MQRNTVGALLVAVGFAVWLVPMAASGTEPWDASLGLYCLVMALAGAAGMALASPRRSNDIMRWPGFIVLGEVLYLLFQPDRWSLWPLALIALAVMAAPAVVGAWLADLTLQRQAHKHDVT